MAEVDGAPRPGLLALTGTVVAALLFVPLFNAVGLGVLLQLPPVAALGWVAILAIFFVGLHTLPGGEGARARASLIRLGPPRDRARAVLAVASSLSLALGTATLIRLTTEIDPGEVSRYIHALVEYQRSPVGWVALAAMTGILVPLVEEFCFRGYIQHSLARRFGPGFAIPAATLLFALAHFGGPHPALLLIPLVIGGAAGVSVRRFDSIWVAVALHTLWNLGMVTSARLAESRVEDVPDGPAVAVAALALLVLGIAGWVRVLRRST
jgi:membrane protease YdiL (CAAX protease family)